MGDRGPIRICNTQASVLSVRYSADSFIMSLTFVSGVAGGALGIILSLRKSRNVIPALMLVGATH